jgi:hypothetical protein
MREALAALALLMTAAPSHAAAPMVTSPQDLPADHDRPRIFLGGSIDMGRAVDWQADLVKSLGDLNVLFLNPRRPDWIPNGNLLRTNPNFAARSNGNWARSNRPTSSSCISRPDRKARSACSKWASMRAAES